MKTHQGTCHCGAVVFEVTADIVELRKCNCSLCTRRGAQTIPVKGDELRIVAGEDSLSVYQFNTKVAKHYICKICGIYTFHRPRTGPQDWGVNFGCLAGLDRASLPIKPVDGQSFTVEAS